MFCVVFESGRGSVVLHGALPCGVTMNSSKNWKQPHLKTKTFVTTTFDSFTYVPFYTTIRVESTHLQFSWEFGAWISSFHPNLKLLRA